MDNNAITPSLENYLKTIYLLHKADSSVRLIDVAERMSVSKPSANRAVAELSEKGFVEHEKFGPIRLTDQGIATAQKLLAKFDTIKRFLMNVLNLSEALAVSEACVLEHTIQDVTLNQMAALI